MLVKRADGRRAATSRARRTPFFMACSRPIAHYCINRGLGTGLIQVAAG